MIRSLCLPAAALVASFVQAALAQDPAAPPALPENKAQIEAALKLTKEAAAKYEFTIGADQKPVLLPEPVLKWSNPSVGEIHGNVFLWTLNGRPAVVGSIFKWFSPHTHMSHEFHSLCEQPLGGKYEGAEVWTTTEGGLKFAPATDLPVPAAGKPQRLLQMREFARNCAATKHEKDGGLTELRLLTQPVHRYAAPADGLLDGGLFVFVLGTDPELFVLLEAREAGGKQEWQFAVARMNSVAITLRYKDRELWKADALPSSDVYRHQKPYTSFLHKMP